MLTNDIDALLNLAFRLGESFQHSQDPQHLLEQIEVWKIILKHHELPEHI